MLCYNLIGTYTGRYWVSVGLLSDWVWLSLSLAWNSLFLVDIIVAKSVSRCL